MSETCMAWIHSLLGGRPCSRWRKCAASGSLSALDLDALAVARKVVPVKQHRPQRGQQRIGDVARSGDRCGHRPRAARSPARRRRCAARPWDASARAELKRLLHFSGQTAQAEQTRLVCGQFCSIGQLAVDQQVRDFGKLAVLGQVGNVVSAIVQVVAAVADGADGGFAGGGAGKRDRLLGFEGGRAGSPLERSWFDPRRALT